MNVYLSFCQHVFLIMYAWKCYGCGIKNTTYIRQTQSLKVKMDNSMIQKLSYC